MVIKFIHPQRPSGSLFGRCDVSAESLHREEMPENTVLSQLAASGSPMMIICLGNIYYLSFCISHMHVKQIAGNFCFITMWLCSCSCKEQHNKV